MGRGLWRVPPRIRNPHLRSPRLRLRLSRPEGSVELDREPPVGRGMPDSVPPFVPYREFSREFRQGLRQGEHITTVGATQSGKTTLMLDLCVPQRRYVCVLATKNKDPNLYPKLQRMGFVLSEDPDLNDESAPKVIFKPTLRDTSPEAKGEQSEAFRQVLDHVFQVGGWCLYGDEVRYLAKNLKLETELDTLWLQGSTLDVSMYVSTQRPVSIPVVAFEAATHLFLFRTTDRRNIERTAEFEGANEAVLKYILPRLPKYEVLYVNTRTGEMKRTKVIR